MNDPKWATIIGKTAVVRRPQRFVRNSGFKPEDFEQTFYYDRMDKLVSWMLVLAAIVVLAVSFGEWM